MKNETSQPVDAEVVDDAVVSTALEQITRSEVNMQIATARQFPRSVKDFIEESTGLACLSEDVAASCLYALPRSEGTIEGPSARFAEIVASSWGHIRAQGRIMEIGDKFVTAMGTAWDIQKNNLIQVEVKRRITNRQGKRFNDDMIQVACQAAVSIAVRNARLQVVPKAYWGPVLEQARLVVRGKAETLTERRKAMLAHFQKLGVRPEHVFERLGVKGEADITLDHMVTLRAVAESIKSGEVQVDSAFPSVSGGGGSASDTPAEAPLDVFIREENVPEEVAAELRSVAAASKLTAGKLAAELKKFKGNVVGLHDELKQWADKAAADQSPTAKPSEQSAEKKTQAPKDITPNLDDNF